MQDQTIFLTQGHLPSTPLSCPAQNKFSFYVAIQSIHYNLLLFFDANDMHVQMYAIDDM
jgi:hypothetical protein